jgi:hypothetical protein
MSTMLDAALAYAQRGWPVFPCNGKAPYTEHGVKDATTDERILRGWWKRWPKANIGLACGSPSGMYVIDEDDGGVDTIGALGLPPTLTVLTGGGGRHFYFVRPESGRWPNTAKKIGPGVDSRGDGGYVLLPPSIHPDTGEPYEWLNKSTPAPLPSSVIAALTPKPVERRRPRSTTPPPSAYAEKALREETDKVANAPQGQRNHTLNAAAFSLGQLVGAGILDEGDVRAELEDAAARAGLGEQETDKTINSGLSSGQRQPRDIPERAVPGRVCPVPESVPSKEVGTGTDSIGGQGELVRDSVGTDGDGDRDGLALPERSREKRPATQGDAWPLPAEIEAFTATRAVRFPLEALPECVRGYVDDVAERMQCAPDLVAIPAIVALATCIGGRVKIRPKQRDDHEEPSILWGMCVAPPGSNKSSAQKSAFAPVRAIEARWAEEDDAAYALAIEEATERGGKKAASEVPEPVPRRLTVQNATAEKLADILSKNGRRGLCMVHDELSGWADNLSRYTNGTDRPFFLEAWSAGPYRVDRIARGAQYIPSVHLSICGGIQPDVAGRVFGSGADDGLADRFGLVAFPDMRPGFDLVDRWPDAVAKRAYFETCEALASLDWADLLKAGGAAGGTPFVRFDDRAQARFNAWLTHHMGSRDEWSATRVAGLMAKAFSYVARIALVLHLAGYAGREHASLASVSDETLQRTLAIVSGYLVPTWRRLSGAVVASPAAASAVRIAKYIIERRPTVIRCGDITKLGWRNMSKLEDVRAAFEVLVDMDWVARPERIHRPNGGRPSGSYAVNPLLRDLFEVSPGGFFVRAARPDAKGGLGGSTGSEEGPLKRTTGSKTETQETKAAGTGETVQTSLKREREIEREIYIERSLDVTAQECDRGFAGSDPDEPGGNLPDPATNPDAPERAGDDAGDDLESLHTRARERTSRGPADDHPHHPHSLNGGVPSRVRDAGDAAGDARVMAGDAGAAEDITSDLWGAE